MDCAEEIGCENNISIESLCKDFHDWRNNKTTNRIPEHLWDKVFLLLTNTDMSAVANQLGLSYGQIRKKRAARASSRPHEPSVNHTPEFITVAMDSINPECDLYPETLHLIKISMRNGNVLQCEVTTDILYQLIHGDGNAAN